MTTDGTVLGPVPVQRAKLRDRGAGEAGGERITFSSAILPKWARRTKSLEALVRLLYCAAYRPATFRRPFRLSSAIEAPNLSPAVIGRLKEEWTVGLSTQSWRELLVDLKARGLSIAPEIAVAINVTSENHAA